MNRNLDLELEQTAQKKKELQIDLDQNLQDFEDKKKHVIIYPYECIRQFFTNLYIPDIEYRDIFASLLYAESMLKANGKEIRSTMKLNVTINTKDLSTPELEEFENNYQKLKQLYNINTRISMIRDEIFRLVVDENKSNIQKEIYDAFGIESKEVCKVVMIDIRYIRQFIFQKTEVVQNMINTLYGDKEVFMLNAIEFIKAFLPEHECEKYDEIILHKSLEYLKQLFLGKEKDKYRNMFRQRYKNIFGPTH